MRNFRIRRTKPIFISKAAFINVTLLAGIAIFVALAVLTGRAVSDNIFKDTGVNASSEPSDTKIIVTQPTATPELPKNTPPEETSTGGVIKIEAKDYYFVQFGMFSNEDNAKTCADSIAALGGAGYIKNTDGKFYVFAMCYSNGNDAKTVVTNLKTQGYSTLLKCFSHNGMTMNISGSEESINKIETAYNGVIKATDEIEEIIYKFDKGEIDRIELKNQLRELLSLIESNKDTFSLYAEQNDIFANAKTLCEAYYSDISGLLKLESDIELKSRLKNTYITSVFELIEYLDNAVVG